MNNFSLDRYFDTFHLVKSEMKAEICGTSRREKITSVEHDLKILVRNLIQKTKDSSQKHTTQNLNFIPISFCLNVRERAIKIRKEEELEKLSTQRPRFIVSEFNVSGLFSKQHVLMVYLSTYKQKTLS